MKQNRFIEMNLYFLNPQGLKILAQNSFIYYNNLALIQFNTFLTIFLLNLDLLLMSTDL